ncbi:MobH family relaxase [Vibrio aestuarianus]|uniref:MobH family relaxase n=1 Tax=Vibrio aestuarianus TaxID=28171 RepID=UPI001558E609|nr:MobH family relaxase [Vibrio aestuarianus]
MRFVNRWLTRNKGEPPSSKVMMYGLDNLDDDVIGYPPSPKGIPVVQTDVLLTRMQKEIDFIRNELGLKPEEFTEYIEPVMKAFIAYADLLPASEYKHHATGGGLIYHSFDVAKRAMRSAQCTQFPIGLGTVADTQQSNKQWRTATVLAALLHDGGKILADMVISNGMEGDERITWDAHGDKTVHDWAAQHNIDRYYISWRNQRHQKHQNASLMVMQRLIPQRTWSWLEDCYDGKEIHTAMLNAVAKAGIEHPMSMIVAKTDSESVKKDMFHRNSHITKEVKRVPLSEMLCDLMKHYILSGQWEINRKNAPVWYVDNTLYIVWSHVAPILVDDMHNAGYQIPAVPEVLARAMIEEGMAIGRGNELYYKINPEILGEPKKPVTINCLKVRNVQRLILDPAKLYSIKEHPKKKEKEDAKPESAKAVEAVENDVTESSSPAQPTPAKPKKRFESSIDTLNRVLGLMKVKRAEDIQQHDTESNSTPEIEGIPTVEHTEIEHNSWGYEDELTVQFKQQKTENTESPTPIAATTVSIEHCPLTKFIESEYNYPRVDGKLQIPLSDTKLLVSHIMNTEPDGINVFTLEKDLFDAKGVAFV